MPRYRSRAQLRQRAKTEAHRLKAGGSWGDREWNHALQWAYSRIFEQLSISCEGFNLACREYTIGPTPPEAPAGPVLALPNAFLDLRSLSRMNGQGVGLWGGVAPRRATYKLIRDRGGEIFTGTETPGYYLIEGPGTEFDDGLGIEVAFVQRLRFWPDLREGERITLAYATQPIDLGDVELVGVADDLTKHDVISDAVESAICAVARAQAAEKADPKEYARAIQERDQAIKDFEAHRRRRDSSEPETLDMIATSYRGGYGSW